MKNIISLVIVGVFSIYFPANTDAQGILSAGTISSVSITDFGSTDPSFQTKWAEYLRTRTWKYASGHVTFTQNTVRLYVRYHPTEELQEMSYSVEKIDSKKDETGRNSATLTLKSLMNYNYFPAFLLYDDKDWVFTLTGTETIATWRGKVI